jgi:SAM-dependent methyltransferase
MNRAYELKFHMLEENHWWFEARRDMIVRLLKRVDKQAKILDVGCSGGLLIRALRKIGYRNVQGIDISGDAIDLCKRTDIPDVQVMDAAKLKFENEQFDVVIASDLLEHVKEEETALSEWHRILKPGGKLIVFVPAFGFLWSEHDEANQHYRRYSKSRLVGVLEKAHFEIDRSSYWNFLLFFPTTLIRLLQTILLRGKRSEGDQLIELGSAVNKCLTYLIKTENIILSVVNLPVGVSVFAMTRKEIAASVLDAA